MSKRTQLEKELERRLVEVETIEASDPSHARLSGRSIATFLAVVFGIVAVALIGMAL